MWRRLTKREWEGVNKGSEKSEEEGKKEGIEKSRVKS